MDPSGSGEVALHVYDLVDNSWLYWLGCGIFHSGVEVYGQEFAFGGHDQDSPGVFATPPTQAPGPVRWRERIVVGRTGLSPQETYDLVRMMGQEYKGNKYHLLQKNCNNFSADLCQRLTGNAAPAWINRAANMAVALHCLLPQGWLPPLQPPTAAPITLTAEEEAELDAEDDDRKKLLSMDGPLTFGSKVFKRAQSQDASDVERI